MSRFLYPNHPFAASDTTSNTASTVTPADEPGHEPLSVQAGQICDSSVPAVYRHLYSSAEHTKPSDALQASASGSHSTFTRSQVVVVVVEEVIVVVDVVGIWSCLCGELFVH